MSRSEEEVESSHAKVRRMELRLRDLTQLFNSMDPSPFHEKDLDRNARDFIVSWAMEFPRDSEFELSVHLDNPPQQSDAQAVVSDAVHNFFAYEAELKRRELRDLMARGRISLIIGLVFLAACLTGSQFTGRLGDFTYVKLLQESMVIGGWVAMWRPLEIFLYEWWPIRRMRRLFLKLAVMRVRVITPTESAPHRAV